MKLSQYGFWVVAPWLLMACNENDTAAVSPLQLRQIVVETPPMAGGSLQVTEQRDYRAEPATGALRMTARTNAGVDTVWGTVDDTVGYTVVCSYSGQSASTPLDQQRQLAIPQSYLLADTGSINFSIMMSIMGITEMTVSPEEHCLPSYGGQAVLEETLYSGDDLSAPPQRWLKWARSTTGGQPVATRTWGRNATATPLIIGNRYEYGSASNVVKYLIPSEGDHYFKYEFDSQQRPVMMQEFQYVGDYAPWPGEQPGDVLIQTTTFRYDGVTSQECGWAPVTSDGRVLSVSGAKSMLPVQVKRVTRDGYLREQAYFTAGPDAQACTSDDVLVRKENYTWGG